MAGDRRGVVAHAIDEAGNPVALQEHQLQAASDASLKPISATEAALRAQADVDANYVDENYGTLGKAALGAASGVTLGIGPALAVKTGFLDAGHYDAAQQSSAFTAGDVAGTLLPAFLSGGTSLEARGAGSVVGRALAATPAGALGRAGGVAESLVSRFLPEAGILGKTASGSIKMAARGATEGALMNVAHQASHDIIINKPLSAQSLLASAEDGALFGGLTGGILGGGAALAGVGVESLGNRAASVVGGAGGERSAGVALKRLGLPTEQRFVGALGDYTDLIQKSGSSLSSSTSHIRESVTRLVEEQELVANAALRELGQIAQPPPSLKAALFKRFDLENQVMYAGTADQREAGLIYRNLKRDIEGKSTSASFTEKAPVAPKPPDTRVKFGPGQRRAAFAAEEKYKAALEAHKDAMSEWEARGTAHVSAADKAASANQTWEHWAKNREILADRAKSATGVKKGIYESALNALDDEFRLAGEATDSALFKQYAAATTQRRIGQELIDSTANKLTQEANRGNPLHLNGADAATGAYGLIAGHPMGAAGIILGKKITGYIQDKLEPTIAEYAARSALGSSAGAATANVGARLSGALKSFMSGARVSTEKAHAEGRVAPKKLSYTMKAYEQQMALAEQLTSQAHQAKVRETTEALAMAGHDELAQELQNTYGRAVAYVNANKPKNRSKEAGVGSLSKPPKQVGLDTQSMKFLRGFHALNDTVGTIVNGLEKGNLSRDAITAIKYVMPDLHQDLVLRASQEVMAMKAEGKYLPADKEALLGVALDYPVSSKLTPEFIAEVQKGHAANRKPPQEGNAPPVTDTSSYQTPLQASVV